MTHSEKVAHFEQLLRDRGYWVSNAIPPACRLLWWLGFETPPPYFLSFAKGALVSGIPFGIVYTVFMSAYNWMTGESSGHVVFSFVFVTIFFGVCMGGFYSSQGRSLNLPDWKDFPSPESTKQAKSMSVREPVT